MRFSILLLLVCSSTSSFGFVPSAHAQLSKAESDSLSFAKDTNTVIPSSTSLCNSNQVDSATMSSSIPKWFQKEISITAPSRGCHLITSEVNKAIQKDMSGIKIGMANLFIQHTSASLTINENADPDVRRDMEVAMNKIVPGSWTRDGTFLHTMEGDDDRKSASSSPRFHLHHSRKPHLLVPGHVKSSMMGVSLNIPIRNGRLALGTWQGIYLNEYRDQGGWGGGHTRNIVITLQGQS